MTQRDKWQQEVERLSKRRYKKTNDEVREVYKEALKEMKERLKQYTDNYNDLTFAKKLEVERLFGVANEMDRILQARYDTISQAVVSGITAQAENGYYGVWYALEEANNLELQMGLLNPELINQAITKPVGGKRLSTRLYSQRDELAKSATHEIVNGLFNGSSYGQIAKNLSEYAEADYKRALRIIRTEGGRIRSETTQIGYQRAEKLGVTMEKQWLATLDRKTRHDHRYLDGQTVPVDGEFTDQKGNKATAPRLFGIASEDINCRCTTIAVVEGVRPELRRDNETGEVGKFGNYDEWLANKQKNEPKVTKTAKIPNAKVKKTGYNDGSKNNPEELMPGLLREKPMTVEKADNHNANPNYLGGKEVQAKQALYNKLSKEYQEDIKRHYKIPYDKPEEANKSRELINKKVAEINRLSKEINEASRKAQPYSINCQRCAPAYELRRRGYDVNALPNNGGTHEDVYDKPKNMWRDVDGNIQKPQMMKARGNSAVTSELLDKMQPGERGTLNWAWSRQNVGHIINVERTEEGLMIIDAQSGKIASTFEEYMGGNTFRKTFYGSKYGVFYNRVDDKYIDLENIGIIVKGAE